MRVSFTVWLSLKASKSLNVDMNKPSAGCRKGHDGRVSHQGYSSGSYAVGVRTCHNELHKFRPPAKDTIMKDTIMEE